MRGRVADEELRAWYQHAAVFVSLSELESFGLAVLEAAAAGVPVLASDIPAHRESTAWVPAGRITLVPSDGDSPTIAAAIDVVAAAGAQAGVPTVLCDNVPVALDGTDFAEAVLQVAQLAMDRGCARRKADAT